MEHVMDSCHLGVSREQRSVPAVMPTPAGVALDAIRAVPGEVVPACWLSMQADPGVALF